MYITQTLWMPDIHYKYTPTPNDDCHTSHKAYYQYRKTQQAKHPESSGKHPIITMQYVKNKLWEKIATASEPGCGNLLLEGIENSKVKPKQPLACRAPQFDP
ncbi:hypothetical protein NWF32_10475 [Pseudomonas qingdaonensis]|nr:hypothetical protein [Pseudomonas qingdaonensis]